MKLVETRITRGEPAQMAEAGFGDMVKGAVDVKRGVNPYPDLPQSEWIEFDSMINIRPSQGNRSRGAEDPAIRDRVVSIVAFLLVDEPAAR